VLWALDLPEARRPAAPLAPVQLAEVGADPELRAQLAAAMGPDGGLVAGRFERGCRCLAAWAGGRVVAYAWLSTGPEWVGELGCWIRPGASEAYVWNCVTAPPYRRQRLYTALLGEAAGGLCGEGLVRLWVVTLEDVPHAGRGVATAGFRPALSLSAICFGALQLLETSPARGADRELSSQARRVVVGRRVGRRPAPVVH
jgi:hypothetical protein